MRTTDLWPAAQTYLEKGWLPMPLMLDNDGLPKRPMVQGWTHLTPADVPTLPWDRASGIGLVLGNASNRLAAIDVDDKELAAWFFAELVRHHLYCRMVWTARGRLHIFVQEETASPSRKFTVQWQGRNITIELKANGTQVATAPSPGYVLACDKDPAPATTIIAAWKNLAERAGIRDTEYVRGDYPRPWQPVVVQGDRNKAAYVEAHRLREARVPLEQAVELMRSRWESAYQSGGIAWNEIQRTVKSAYAKGLPAGRVAYEVWAR